MNVAEERAVALLDALEVDGFPDDEDHERLVEFLAAWNDVRLVPGRRVGMCLHYPDGTSRVTIPLHRYPRRLNEAIARQIGHVLMNTGLGALLASFDAPIAYRVQVKDESLALRFALAWELPVDTLWPLFEEQMADSQIAEIARCTPEMATLRRAQLTEPGAIPDRLGGRTRWSAAREYALRWQPLADTAEDGSLLVRHSFQVVARRDGRPQFEASLSSGASQEALEAARFRLEADLRALTTREFRLKYRHHAYRPGQEAVLLDPWEFAPPRFRGHGAGASRPRRSGVGTPELPRGAGPSSAVAD